MSKITELLQTIESELKTAEVISASPTRSGRKIQVRVCMGKRTGRCTFFNPKPRNLPTNNELQWFLEEICSVYKLGPMLGYTTHDRSEYEQFLEQHSTQLKSLWDEAHKQACEQVKNCEQTLDRSQRMKAKKALKSWIMLAFKHGMKDSQLVELFNECRTESLLSK